MSIILGNPPKKWRDWMIQRILESEFDAWMQDTKPWDFVEDLLLEGYKGLKHMTRNELRERLLLLVGREDAEFLMKGAPSEDKHEDQSVVDEDVQL